MREQRSRQILHVDMDAFYASVEQRNRPELRGLPVIVGGNSKRGVVSAASYEARAFGVHSAQPMVEALRRCPQAVVVSGDHANYGQVSEEIFAIFRRYTPLVEGLSLDEAFLDVTESRSLFGDGVAIATLIKNAIKTELDLTASAGVASCKFAAKIASDMDKPNGLTVVPKDVAGFLAPLPVEKMWGVGPVAARRMHDHGFGTIGDLARADPGLLERILGSWGRHVHSLANGIDDRAVESSHAAKSIGAEETFERDVTSLEVLERHLLAQSARVAERLFRKGMAGRAVTVKIKYADFTLRTRRVTLPEGVCDTDSIFAAAKPLLATLGGSGRPVRLTGVSVGNFTAGAQQQTLFPNPERKRREELEAVTSKIRDRFGGQSLKRATLLEED